MQTASTASLQNVIEAPFRDPQWKQKLLIGSALMFGNYIIPFIPGIPLIGYYGRMMRRIVQNGGEPALPDWDDWGSLFSDGLRLGVVGLVYMLPAFLMLFAGYIAILVPTFVMNIQAQSGMADPGAALGSLLAMPLGMFLMALGFILMVLIGVFGAAAFTHAAVQNSISAGFRVREWWPIFRANMFGFVLNFVLVVGFSMVMSLLAQVLYMTVILCFLMPVAMCAASVLSMWAAAPLNAQAYLEGVRRVSEKGIVQEG